MRTGAILNSQRSSSTRQNPNTIYAGTRLHGVYKSTDGGHTWAAANQGLAGVNPYALAVSPDNLDEVYSVSQSNGVAKSSDGGRHWSSLNFQRNGFPWQQTSLVVDPHDPRVVYLGKWCPKAGRNRPRPRTHACASAATAARPGRMSSCRSRHRPTTNPARCLPSRSIRRIPGRVLAGATFYPFNWSQNVEHPFGAIYYSDDYGQTWSRSNLDATLLKGSYSIAFDSQQANLVYAGTDGTGLWKTTDGGVTWARVSWTGCADTGEPNTSVSVHAFVTQPKVSGSSTPAAR